MIPEGVHFLPAIPRTESGKIDEKRLPHVNLRAGPERSPAQTQLQSELVTLVQQILVTTAEIGIKDDFFVLGGQSLKAVELISHINHRYGAHVQLREFYTDPTVEHLERLLVRSSTGKP